jgi:hypothetical protein
MRVVMRASLAATYRYMAIGAGAALTEAHGIFEGTSSPLAQDGSRARARYS